MCVYNNNYAYPLYTPQESAETEDLPLYTTYCSRVSEEEFHSVGQDRALAEVAALLETVQKMPDGPQKTHFLKMVSRYMYYRVLVCA